jgi:D-alanyl-D-alanine carboxypeptidase
MMKLLSAPRILALTCLALTSSHLGAQTQDHSGVLTDFKSGIPRYGISPLKEQAFCYSEAGVVRGYQVDKLQRVASVTKLFTTLLASETLDLKKRYQTKLYISGTRLHIEGSNDPYFEEENLLLLMDALNSLGYTSFTQVTFNKFFFTDVGLGQHEVITTAHIRTRLATYMNRANAKLLRNKWLEAAKFALEENVTLDLTKSPLVHASSVAHSETNPLLNLVPTVYTHTSRPLHSIIKAMNVMSKNHVAQNLYLEAGGIQGFDALMLAKGVPKATYRIYNGNGLPIKSKRARTDNLATCRSVLKIISLLGLSLKKHQLVMSDVVAVSGGEDLGSFRDRFTLYPETREAVMSKTGTLSVASSLAGVLLIDDQVPFAILNHTSNVANSRRFQDYFVSRMFHHLGEPTPIEYTKLSTFPWDETPYLAEGSGKRQFNLRD